MTSGYSGTPLARKLSLKPGMTAWYHAMPETVRIELCEAGVEAVPGPIKGLDAAHIFVSERAELAYLLGE